MIPDDGELVVFSRVQIGLKMSLVVDASTATNDFVVPEIFNNEATLLFDCLLDFVAPKPSNLLVNNVLLLRI